MSFELTETALTDHIAEQQWGKAQRVGFTYFDSCLGLIGKSGGQVIGVHLVMVVDKLFDDEAAALAASLVLGCSEVHVIGNVYMWEDNVPAFRTMAGLVGGAWTVKADRGSGTYGGRVQGGRLQHSANGVWHA